MEYRFAEIEKKWKKIWNECNVYHVPNNFSKPKCYVLDMFPYPSGAGLHVGHPLGYIASDIYARYKKMCGYNVLHPMGFDSFGLPAEQYALDTGQHPTVTTQNNIARYKEQLNNIGFCYDWQREVKTSDPLYYKWTQWIFLKFYNSYYNTEKNKAEPIEILIEKIKTEQPTISEDDLQKILMNRRLAFQTESYVNWCEALGTVLANDEVVNGVSERGGHPVERKLMKQWFLRITAYAERLLQGLNEVDYPESLKEMQRNWIGKSEGAIIKFEISNSNFQNNESNIYPLDVFTTRPDTIFGVSFLVLAPEHPYVKRITTQENAENVLNYIKKIASIAERDRLVNKKISGCFTGAYAIHPFTKKEIPIWISDYVLMGYGTGAIMAVPCGDERDYAFAQHFNLPIHSIFKDVDITQNACMDKSVILAHSDFLNNLSVKEASQLVIHKLEELNIGIRKINYRMRDAGFSRQRYWGEPFPIYYDKNGNTHTLPENELPLQLPHLERYTAGPNGKGPLANATEWVNINYGLRETDTMPGYAGSSWYYLRYMDNTNENKFCDRKISDYWNQVDVYMGGAEHAVGHLLYSRMWCKALYDLGYIGFDEPYKKIINQGMIGGKSYFCDFLNNSDNGDNEINYIGSYREFHSDPLTGKYINPTVRKIILKYGNIETRNYRVKNADNFLDNHFRLTENKIKEYCIVYPNDLINTSEIIYEKNLTENGEKYIQCEEIIEKMSKSKYNVVNPDDMVAQYGADTFRMYEMFLGPIEQSKPWDTKGIEGVHRFLKKTWRLYVDEKTGLKMTHQIPTPAQLKVLHKTIKKIIHDTEHFSFNTAVSAFMIAVNELSELNTTSIEILTPFLLLLQPYAPHICDELYAMLYPNEMLSLKIKNTTENLFPQFNEEYLRESTFTYPVAVNGKHRTDIEFALDLPQHEIEKKVQENELVIKWMEGKPLKKIILVKGRMINIVV